MIPFSFIHAADLHLDSPFVGVTAEAPQIAGALRNATFSAFNALVELCLQKEVDFLLLAGDVFDWMDRSLKAQLHLRDGLERLSKKGISTFIVYGNHDPLSGKTSPIKWPDNTHIFGSASVETKVIKKDGEAIASVSGISYQNQKETRNLAKLFKRPDEELFSIGLLHCNVGKNTGHESYAPCELKDLLDAGMDYWAIGHVHKRTILSTEPFVVYPGNIQGRNIKEQGEKGCYLVEVSQDGATNSPYSVSLSFHPLDSIKWEECAIGIEDIKTVDELEESVHRKILALDDGEASGRSLVCRVHIKGRGPLFHELQEEDFEEDFLERIRDTLSMYEPFVWLQSLHLSIKPEIDLEKRALADDLLGQVLRISEDYKKMKPEERNEILRKELAALFENRRLKKAIDAFDQEELDEILRDAELLSVDRLEEEGD